MKVKVGIIPAGAGLTIRTTAISRSARDHPRRCGAHYQGFWLYQFVVGSSPQVRGSLTSILFCSIRSGIIPAGAGLTGKRGLQTVKFGDHPRRCGAHLPLPFFGALKPGSSPQVRGSRLAHIDQFPDDGIIPAGAGLTQRVKTLKARRRDHPRRCGAHPLLRLHCLALEGSSPQVRGSRCRVFRFGLVVGIIPAGAGLTISCLVDISVLRDHPRRCGAHLYNFTF